MKKYFAQTIVVLGFVLSYGLGYAQTPAAVCLKKGTADCPLVKNRSEKGTKDGSYAVSTASLAAKNVKTDCVLQGTAVCKIENCPLKGTPNCPLVKNITKVSFASNKTVAKTKKDDDVTPPPCCRKATY